MAAKIPRTAAVLGAVEIAEEAISGSGIPKLRYAQKEAGRLVPEARLLAAPFTDVLSELPIDFRKLGDVHTVDALRQLLIDARLRLGSTTVTRDNWLGKSFEILAPRLPEVLQIENLVVRTYVGIANDRVARARADVAAGSHSGFAFMTGQYEPALVTQPFGTIERVHDISIRLSGQPTGLQGPDRGILIRNADGDLLFVSIEFKTAGAAGKLGPQSATRDDRILGGKDVNLSKPLSAFDEAFTLDTKGRPGSLASRDEKTLAYTVEGGQPATTPFDRIILLRDPAHPEALLPTDYLSRIGIAPGRTLARKAKTKSSVPGGPTIEYVRIGVDVDTRYLGDIIERLLRDPRWQ